MKKNVLIGAVILLMMSLVLACPKQKIPGEDYPDWNEDGIDDSTQVFTPTNRTELFAILDYQKEYEDKGWMVKSIDVSKVDLTTPIEVSVGIDSTGALFYNREDFNQDLSNWDVSQVTDMSGLFLGAESFNQDLSNWDMLNVTDTKFMFHDATAFNQDISDWDVNNVTDFQFMFYFAESFNQNLKNWNVSGKTTTNMFLNSPMEDNSDYWPLGYTP